MASKLGETLVRKGFISEGQLSEALDRQNEEGGLLGSILVEMGYAHGEQIRQVLTRKYGGVSIGLADVDIEPELAGLISEETARRYGVVPIARARGRIAVAMVDPTDVNAADEPRFLTGYSIEPMIAAESEVLQKIDTFYASTAEDTPGDAILEHALVAYENPEVAGPALERALEVVETCLGDDPTELARTLTDLGAALGDKGRNTDARSCYQRAWMIAQDTLGDAHPQTGITVLSLAQSYSRERRFADAEPLLELAVELLSTTDDPAAAEARAALGACRWSHRALPHDAS